MRAAIYCRVSTEDQRERQSIDAQVDYAKEYCERNRIEIAGFYLDNGVSGSVAFADRAQGGRLLSDASMGHFDTVLVYMFDRFARDVFEGLAAVRMLEDKKVRVKSMTESFDTSDPQGMYMFVQSLNNAQLWKSQYLQRSMDSTVRLVEHGVWMGGICPFGYRVEGKDRGARIVPSEEPIDGLDVSEAEVVRMMYHWIANDKRSCWWVCQRLDEMKVPPAYSRDGRAVTRNKRKEATTGIWRPARVRNLIVNKTYMGIHEWGKRGKGKVIERDVPAIVDPDTWQRAQAVLRENQIMSSANRKHDYLLRGLIKCGLCGLNFCGVSHQTANGEKSYYRCNGRAAARGIYGNLGKVCPSRTVAADEAEALVWSDIEGFLRNPAKTLEELAALHLDKTGEAEKLRAELEQVRADLRVLDGERQEVITMRRKSLIDDTDLEKQMADIQTEENEKRKRIRELESRTQGVADTKERLRLIEEYLAHLQNHLDAPISWEARRNVVELLVDRVVVDSEPGREEVYIRPRYVLEKRPARTETVILRDTDSSQPQG